MAATYKNDFITEVQLVAKQWGLSQVFPLDIQVRHHYDMVRFFEAMVVDMRATIYGEQRTKLVQVPDGFWQYVKAEAKKRLPARIASRIKVRTIDWSIEFFRAYPELAVPALPKQRSVVHMYVSKPLDHSKLYG